MNLSRHTRAARPAFTLVELLVVIAIIAILVGLISAAVIKALGAGNQTRNMADIRQVAASVQAFQMQMKVPYFPSRIKLCKYVAHYNSNNALDRDSLAFLNEVWPRLRWTVQRQQGQQPPVTFHFRIDWNGTPGGGGDDVTPVPPPVLSGPNQNIFMLDGGQCLVYFLGGIPTSSGTPGTLGFSTNPLNPTVGRDRVSPFYEFKSNRLQRAPGAQPAETFFYYLDAYGVRPYAYFSSYGKRNGYNKYFQPQAIASSDCADRRVYGLATGVWPLADQVGQGIPRYLNPDSFQIISAGANETFGPGTIITGIDGNGNWLGTNAWSYRQPGPAYLGNTAGSDDQSNFHSLLLGVAAE